MPPAALGPAPQKLTALNVGKGILLSGLPHPWLEGWELMCFLDRLGLLSGKLSCSSPCSVLLSRLGYLEWLSWLKDCRLRGHILAPFPTRWGTYPSQPSSHPTVVMTTTLPGKSEVWMGWCMKHPSPVSSRQMGS